LRAGYEFHAGSFLLSPLAGLDYGFYQRPDVKERDGGATRLNVESASFHSLRSAIGGQIRTNAQFTENVIFRTGFSAQWMHDIMDMEDGSKASFADYSGEDFSVTNRTDDRDALALNAFVKFVTDETLSIGLHLDTELFRTDSSLVQGSVSLGWKF
jgi:outer membrane autotransporter protein